MTPQLLVARVATGLHPHGAWLYATSGHLLGMCESCQKVVGFSHWLSSMSDGDWAWQIWPRILVNKLGVPTNQEEQAVFLLSLSLFTATDAKDGKVMKFWSAFFELESLGVTKLA